MGARRHERYGGRRFWTFNILDEGVREGLASEVDTSVPAERVQDFHSPVHTTTLSHNINLVQACHAEEESVSF